MPTKSSVKSLHLLLRGAYGVKWNPDTDEAAKFALARMWDEFGPERTERAVHSCIENEQFFTVAGLRQHVPAKPQVLSFTDQIVEWERQQKAEREADPEGFEKAQREFREKLKQIAQRKSM